jgi:hypothetical protein
MSEQTPSCPRCQVAMSPGALRNTIRSSWWHGLTPTVAGSNRVRWEGDSGPYRVSAYRCPSCGLVELAATERPSSSGSSGCLAMVFLLAGLGAGAFVAVGRLLAG